MLMATAQTVVQVCGGTVPSLFSSKNQLSKLLPEPLCRHFVRHNRRNTKARIACQFLQHSVISNSLGLTKCNCQRAESVSGLTPEDSWYGDNAKEYNAINGNKPSAIEFEKSSSEKVGFSSNGDIHNNGSIRDFQKDISQSIEDEAWELLKESVVNYCGSPVGTVAAKDTTDSNVLNYDHVFIRDFIPSGIAFLLKGECDIVRNFILHTLQLQVKTLFYCMFVELCQTFWFYH